MKGNYTFKKIFSDHKNEGDLSPSQFRQGIVAAAILYSAFAIIDLFHLPINWGIAWFIRLGLILPFLIFCFVLSYTKKIYPYLQNTMIWLMFGGQIGILAMIYISEPTEIAYWAYYAGLILVFLWSGFVFQMRLKYVIYLSISNIVLYNAVAIFKQGLLNEGLQSESYYWFLGNNFFLISAGVISIVGAYQLKRYQRSLIEQNKLIKQERDELKIAKQKAEESDNLKSAFLATMSHELRTPLNAVLGFSELIERDLSMDTLLNYKSIINNNAQNLLEIIESIFELSSLESGEIKAAYGSVSVDEIMTDMQHVAETELSRSQNKQVQLRQSVPANAAQTILNTDKSLFQKILTNLLKNAFKFTDKGYVEYGYNLKDTALVFYIKDSGIGIPPEKQEIIFDRFRQVDDSYSRRFGGIGMGLSISKKMAEVLNYPLWLESEEGQGTTFFVKVEDLEYIPEIPETETKTPKSIETVEKKKILLVEDEESIFIYFEQAIPSDRFELIWARNGLDGVNQAQENSDLAMIFMDIKMPVMDGYKATEEIRKFNTEVPIIAQTAFAMIGEDALAFEKGCNEYITKPIRLSKLKEMILKYSS